MEGGKSLLSLRWIEKYNLTNGRGNFREADADSVPARVLNYMDVNEYVKDSYLLISQVVVRRAL